jgi:hypothetical protein
MMDAGCMSGTNSTWRERSRPWEFRPVTATTFSAPSPFRFGVGKEARTTGLYVDGRLRLREQRGPLGRLEALRRQIVGIRSYVLPASQLGKACATLSANGKNLWSMPAIARSRMTITDAHRSEADLACHRQPAGRAQRVKMACGR